MASVLLGFLFLTRLVAGELAGSPEYLKQGVEAGLKELVKSVDVSGSTGPLPVGFALHPAEPGLKSGWQHSSIVIHSVGPTVPAFHQKAYQEMKMRFERWKKDGRIEAYVIFYPEDKKVSLVTCDQAGAIQTYAAQYTSHVEIKKLTIGDLK